MDPRLLSHYNDELRYIRELAADFARQNPAIAPQLSLSAHTLDICPDPYVERLIESFAFLSARIQLKFETEFPRFTQALLESIYPSVLTPLPAMSIVCFHPERQHLRDGQVIERGSIVREENPPGLRAPCRFRTAHDVTLWPLEVESVNYFTRDYFALGLRVEGGRAAFRIRLRNTMGEPVGTLSADELTFYIGESGTVSWQMYEEIFARTVAIAVRGVNSSAVSLTVLNRKSMVPVGFEEEDALLPVDARCFEGFRLLREYFALPERLRFFKLRDLASAFRKIKETEVDVFLILDAENVTLEAIDFPKSAFSLYCSPIVNLFERQSEPIPLENGFSEMRVTGDRTRPNDYEVYQVQSVQAFGQRTDVDQTFRPFYMQREGDQEPATAFFTTFRVARAPNPETASGSRNQYAGSDVYLSLVDSRCAPYRADLRHMTVKALWTNAHLPMLLSGGGPANGIKSPWDGRYCLEDSIGVYIAWMLPPTRPRSAETDGELGWQLISHLRANHFTLQGKSASEGATALRQILGLYLPKDIDAMRKQVDGIRSLAVTSELQRVIVQGQIAFTRGLSVSVEVDENAFSGTGAYVFGMVLRYILANYASINSVVETILWSRSRREIGRWKQTPGTCHLI